jgi:hypothetical protein
MGHHLHHPAGRGGGHICTCRKELAAAVKKSPGRAGAFKEISMMKTSRDQGALDPPILSQSTNRARRGSTPVRWRRLRSVIAPADGSPGMADGGSGDTDTTNSGPTWAACEANLREHAVRLRKRRGRYCLRRSCEGYDKASSSNQPDHSYPPLKDRSVSFRRIVLPLC